MYQLFQEYAHRYDLHTPAGHYKRDYEFVLAEIRRVVPVNGRLLDVGCGTGIFIEAALATGLEAYGLDASPGMVEVAAARLGPNRVRLQRMQDLAESSAFDAVCSLSWTIHYCETAAELDDTVRRCFRALRAGGILLIQVANAPQMTGAVNIDQEPGPAGEPDDTSLIHRFQPLRDAECGVLADYVYASGALNELLVERHHLRFCAPERVALALRDAGADQVALVDSGSISPFLVARMP